MGLGGAGFEPGRLYCSQVLSIEPPLLFLYSITVNYHIVYLKRNSPSWSSGSSSSTRSKSSGLGSPSKWRFRINRLPFTIFLVLFVSKMGQRRDRDQRLPPHQRTLRDHWSSSTCRLQRKNNLIYIIITSVGGQRRLLVIGHQADTLHNRFLGVIFWRQHFAFLSRIFSHSLPIF